MTRRVTPPNKTERFCSNCRTWKPREMIASAKWCDGNRQVRYTCAECARRIAARQKDHAG
ncbi:MAG: hypothetical protein JNK95_04955 [Candidatus Competibacter sp.]|nr:hypothetical protein [Candidatus Competibacter sp.]MDG4606464.1 hypothetical protein [Candidatus Contendobacter sp.]MDS4059284.1 hypothetical protein [Candidatus Contendobacter sp.]